MRAHVLGANGVIENTVWVSSIGPGQVDASIGGGIGDSVISGALVPKAGPPRADVIAAIWERIKEDRDRRTQSGYQAGGHWFHGDTFSRTQQIGLVMMGSNIPPGLQWKTMGGSFVTMTQALAGQVFAAAAASDQAHFAHAEALRVQLLAAEDPTTVDIGAGWPESFEG